MNPEPEGVAIMRAFIVCAAIGACVLLAMAGGVWALAKVAFP